MSVTHDIQRVRHELVMRSPRVVRVQPLSPRMLRVTLAGPELAGFHSPGFDDHVKLFFPDPSASDAAPIGRDYTPRRFRPDHNELDIDFVLHGHGPAASWAAQARPGQVLRIGGPRGSTLVPANFAVNLLLGDASALPAIARRLEQLPEGVQALVAIDISDATEQQALSSQAQMQLQWLHGESGSSGDRLVAAMQAWTLPPGDVFAWAAGESGAIRLRISYQ